MHKVQQAIGKEWMRRGWKDFTEKQYLKDTEVAYKQEDSLGKCNVRWIAGD